MSKEKAPIPKELSAKTYSIIMLSSAASTVIMSAIFLFYVPLEQLLSYFVVAALRLSEFIALGILYSLYRRAANPAAGGLVRSGFGEQRPDIGSRAPSQRR